MNQPAHKFKSRNARRIKDKVFQGLCVASAAMAIIILLVLLVSIAYGGMNRFGWDFLTSFNSSTTANQAGIKPALIGSLWILSICALTAVPIGVATALLLEEYKPSHPILIRLHGFIQTNITNLAGVPSIVYGILGVTAFATMFGMFGTMNTPKFTIGQLWYHEYPSEGGKYFYVPVSNRNAEQGPPREDMEFLVAAAPGAAVAQNVRIGEGLDKMRAQLSAIENMLKEQIESTQADRRAPARIDGAKAEQMADAVFAAGVLKGDPAEMRRQLIDGLLALNGKSGYSLTKARRDAFNQIEQAEFATRDVSGLIAQDARPQVRDYRRFYYIQFPFGRSVLAGGLTLMLVVLPVIIVASQEAVRAVPQSMRHGCLALGGTKWQAISKVVLPASIPGICTGTILAMSRAIGEAAPLILLGAVFVTFIPGNLMDGFSAMPLQIYQWAGEPHSDDPVRDFATTAAAGIIALLLVLLSFNAGAVLIRMKFQKPLS